MCLWQGMGKFLWYDKNGNILSPTDIFEFKLANVRLPLNVRQFRCTPASRSADGKYDPRNSRNITPARRRLIRFVRSLLLDPQFGFDSSRKVNHERNLKAANAIASAWKHTMFWQDILHYDSTYWNPDKHTDLAADEGKGESALSFIQSRMKPTVHNVKSKKNEMSPGKSLTPKKTSTSPGNTNVSINNYGDHIEQEVMIVSTKKNSTQLTDEESELARLRQEQKETKKELEELKKLLTPPKGKATGMKLSAKHLASQATLSMFATKPRRLPIPGTSEAGISFPLMPCVLFYYSLPITSLYSCSSSQIIAWHVSNSNSLYRRCSAIRIHMFWHRNKIRLRWGERSSSWKTKENKEKAQSMYLHPHVCLLTCIRNVPHLLVLHIICLCIPCAAL